MKDAPINLPPLPDWPEGDIFRHPEKITLLCTYVRPAERFAESYARAAVLADRAGREEAYRDKFFMPTEGGEGYLVRMETAAPSPAEPQISPLRSESADNGLSLAAEPPVAPVQQEPVAWIQSDHLTKLMHPERDGQAHLCRMASYQIHPDFKPLYTHPDADLLAQLAYTEKRHETFLMAWGKLTERTERAEAERDSLRAELVKAQAKLKLRETMPMKYRRMEHVAEFEQRAERAEAERDSLRSLLQEAREYLDTIGSDGIRAKINAALKGTHNG